MFNIKLEEKSCKMSFKALPVKIQRSKNRQWGHIPPGQIGLTIDINHFDIKIEIDIFEISNVPNLMNFYISTNYFKIIRL